MKNDLTQEELKTTLDYDKYSGLFVWKLKPSKLITIGSVAGSLGGNGYINILINEKTYKAHRLAWLYVNGLFPKGLIDHVNSLRNDNRWCNLREATYSQNQQNRGKQSNNTSGFKGVTLSGSSKWRAQIGVNGGKKYLGTYSAPESAFAAYCEAAKQMHGEFYSDLKGEQA